MITATYHKTRSHKVAMVLGRVLDSTNGIVSLAINLWPLSPLSFSLNPYQGGKCDYILWFTFSFLNEIVSEAPPRMNQSRVKWITYASTAWGEMCNIPFYCRKLRTGASTVDVFYRKRIKRINILIWEGTKKNYMDTRNDHLSFHGKLFRWIRVVQEGGKEAKCDKGGGATKSTQGKKEQERAEPIRRKEE